MLNHPSNVRCEQCRDYTSDDDNRSTDAESCVNSAYIPYDGVSTSGMDNVDIAAPQLGGDLIAIFGLFWLL